MTIRYAKSMLFVPGNRPNRFPTAAAAGADLVVLDLEDAVSENGKDLAREAVVTYLRTGGAAVVRVNSIDSPWHQADIEAVSGVATSIMLPKATMKDSTERLVHDLRAAGTSTVALIESASGVVTAPEVAALAGVERLAFGSLDLAAELGVDPDNWTALSQARMTLVLASAAAGLTPPVDGVTVRLEDEATLSEDAHNARALGFGGKLCIHPRQVSTVNGVFSPTPQETEWARSVTAALEQADPSEGVVTFGGSMIDKPVMLRAQRILKSSHHPEGH